EHGKRHGRIGFRRMQLLMELLADPRMHDRFEFFAILIVRKNDGPESAAIDLAGGVEHFAAPALDDEFDDVRLLERFVPERVARDYFPATAFQCGRDPALAGADAADQAEDQAWGFRGHVPFLFCSLICRLRRSNSACNRSARARSSSARARSSSARARSSSARARSSSARAPNSSARVRCSSTRARSDSLRAVASSTANSACSTCSARVKIGSPVASSISRKAVRSVRTWKPNWLASDLSAEGRIRRYFLRCNRNPCRRGLMHRSIGSKMKYSRTPRRS